MSQGPLDPIGQHRLPGTAQARMAEIKASGTWGSALSTAEFAAIRSVGFVPAGQVFGAAVISIKNAGTYGCPTYRTPADRPPALSRGTQAAVQTVGSRSKGTGNTFRPLVNAMYQGRRAAVDRMVAECVALGAHGVVGVHLDVEPFPAGGGLEFKALGTAISAPGGPPLRHPFTCERSGQDFAKLMLSGWAPVAIVIGISVGTRHIDRRSARYSSGRYIGNAEVKSHTELANRTRRDATEQLRMDVRARHGSGVVTREMELGFEEFECQGMDEAKDQMAQATIVGTAITKFGREQHSSRAPATMVLSLGDPAPGQS